MEIKFDVIKVEQGVEWENIPLNATQEQKIKLFENMLDVDHTLKSFQLQKFLRIHLWGKGFVESNVCCGIGFLHVVAKHLNINIHKAEAFVQRGGMLVQLIATPGHPYSDKGNLPVMKEAGKGEADAKSNL